MSSVPASRSNVTSASSRSTWRGARRLPAGVALIVLCIFGMVALPYWSAGRMEEVTVELRERLTPLQVTLERVHREVLEIANDIRGLWLTGDRALVSNFVQADAAVRSELVYARELASRSDPTLARAVAAAEQAYDQWAGEGRMAAGGEPTGGREPGTREELFASSNVRLNAFTAQMERVSALVRARDEALRDRLERFRRFERVVMLLLGTLTSIVLAYLGWLAWALLSAQRAALEERDQLEAVLASVDSGILLLDRSLRVAVANERAADLLGVPLNELVGSDPRAIRESLRPRLADPDAFEKRLAYLDENPDTVYEDLVEVAHPEPRTLSRYGAPVRDEWGVMLGRIEVYRDVTHALRRERELADANERKDRFVATLSHELRTPLTPILGWIELLRSERDPARVQQGLEAIRRNVQLEAQLVEDLLDLSRVVNQKLELDFRRVDVALAVEAALATVRHLAETKGVELSVALPTEAVVVSADETRFIQIVWNLLSNAIKFTPAGKRVALTAEALGDGLQVVVQDEGEGIRPDFLPHVFKPFEQGHERRHGPRGGLGIGLALARSLVALHGGQITAESGGPGTGARFTFWIPRDRADGKAPISSHQLRSEGEPGRAASADGRGTSPSVGVEGTGSGTGQWMVQAETADPAIGMIEGGEAAIEGKRLSDAQAPRAPSTCETVSRQRVLVVEDNPDTLEAMRVVVESWGYEVMAVSDAATALGFVRDLPLRAIVSDIGMPDVDGLSFATEVRKLGGRVGSHGRVHLIAITGFASQSDRERALAAGFDAYLTKPINFASLRELLDRTAAAALEPQQA